jgi:cell division protein FtsB
MKERKSKFKNTDAESDIVIHPGKGVSVISHKREKLDTTSTEVIDLKAEIRKLKDQNTFLKRTLMGLLE